MKKLIGLTALSVISTGAMAQMDMPTFYGKISKNYMYVDQEDKFNRKSSVGVVDTINSESRLGAKGSYELNSNLTAKYTLELGLNSSANDSGSGSSGRLRMRLAKIDMVSNYGTLTLGQDYTADSSAVLNVDTFKGTVASGNGSDYKQFVENQNKNIGLNYRSRKDLVKYATPVFSGVQYVVSVDKDDKNSNDPAATGNEKYGATYTTHLLSFDKKMDTMTLRLQSSFTHWAMSSTGDNSNLHLGAVLGFGKLTFKAGWSKEENKKDPNYNSSNVYVDTTDKETTRMTAGLTYKLDSHTMRLAYYVTELENKRSPVEKEEDSQISAGYDYAFNKYVSMNTIVSLLEHKEVTATNTNDATVVSVGAVVKF